MALRHPRTVHFWRGKLPHWQVEHGRYFVAIQLYGALPQQAKSKLRELCAKFWTTDASQNNDPQDLAISRLIFREMERWLDRTPRVAHFTNATLCDMIVEAIEKRQQRRI